MRRRGGRGVGGGGGVEGGGGGEGRLGRAGGGQPHKESPCKHVLV